MSFWICGLGGLLGVAAVVLGIVGLGTARQRADGGGRGLAIGGIVTGALAILASIAFVLVVFVLADSSSDLSDINTDPSDGVCDQDRFLQDPDCSGTFDPGGLNSDPPDGFCDEDRFLQDPDC